MVKVCMVAYSNYSTDTRMRREVEALVERGDMVDLICLGERDEVNPEYKNGVRTFKISLPRYRGSNTRMYVSSYLHFFCAALLKLTRLQLKYSYQIIQVHTMPDFLVFTAIVPKLLGAKVIIDVHELTPELYQSKFGTNSKHPVIHFITWVERCSIGFAHRAIAVHRPHLEALCSHGNPRQKFIILMNLPDPKIFSEVNDIYHENQKKFELIYHGMLAERTGLGIAIQAVAKLHKEIPNIHLKIIGFGDALPSLYKTVEIEEAQACVEIHPFMPLEELVPIIAKADVGIVPLIYDDFTRFMLPVKLLEYVAMGKPVICSRTATIEAYFNDAMIQFCSPGNVSELTGAIRDLYEHPEKRKLLSAAASQFTREYNWEKHKYTYFQLIDSLANK